MISSGKRFKLLLLSSLPIVITLMLAILALVSKHVAGLSHFMPLLPLIPIFYWGMMHAREMPYWFVFLFGLIMDAVSGLPLGLSSLLYVVLLALLHTQRKYIYKEGFVVKWGYFSLVLAVVDGLEWIILSLFHGQAQGVWPVLLQWLLTVGCYPVLHTLFDALYDYTHARRWRILHGR